MYDLNQILSHVKSELCCCVVWHALLKILLLLFRAFGLSEENVQVDPEREHIKMTVLQDYK